MKRFCYFDLYAAATLGMAKIHKRRLQATGAAVPTECNQMLRFVSQCEAVGMEIRTPLYNYLSFKLLDLYHDLRLKMYIVDEEVIFGTQEAMKTIVAADRSPGECMSKILDTARARKCPLQREAMYLAMAEIDNVELWTSNRNFNPKLPFVHVVQDDLQYWPT
jgi:hypothetical protein